jgi:microcystin-dependent protein
MSYNLSAFAGAGAQFFTDNGTPLAGGLLYVYSAGTTTPATTYTSNSGAVANSNPIVLDAAGRTPNEIWVIGGFNYKYLLKTSAGVTIGTYDNISGINDPTVFTNYVTVTGTNTLIATSVPPYTAYVTGMTLSFVPVNANTGAVTIDLDGLGARNIYLDATTALSAGDLAAGKVALVEYDGTRFQLVNSSQQIPAGGMVDFARSSPPSGWLAANGAAVSRTTYSALFAAIGTAFGSGDGSTTFNVPDRRDRMSIGSGSTYALAATGGSKDAIVVSHTHTATVTDPGHVHTYTRYSSQQNQSGSATPCWTGDSTQNTGSATTGISVANSTTGSSGTNANLPPYLGLLSCIKY